MALSGLAVGVLACAAVAWPTGAWGAAAYFPGGGGNPPATQIVRELSLKDAAQRGLLKLRSKGSGIYGDQVEMELQNKKISGPVTITIHGEFTTTPRVTPEKQEKIRQVFPEFVRRAEADLNRGKYKTSTGDPIRFKLDYQFRAPSDSPRANYHQILLINPDLDLDEPDPNYRANIDGVAKPNELGSVQHGTFGSLSFANPQVLAHETLHLAGLGDRYGDYYSVGGRKYPYPGHAPSREQLTAFANNHRPPLPPPPAGKIVTGDLPGTGRCDIMGTGASRSCRRIAKRDLKILEAAAGVQVVAKPGDLLLNKDSSRQHYAVGFQTTVFAAPGRTTVAEGVSVFCVNFHLIAPNLNTFDVMGPAAEVPGFEPLAKLLELSGTIQPSLDEVATGMQGAIWNVTDGLSLSETVDPAASSAILTQAGIAEDSHPAGLPYIPDPNAGSTDTAAVTQTDVIETVPAKTTKRQPAATIQYAQLFPSRLGAGKQVRADLLLSTFGSGDRVSVTVQSRTGRRVRSLPRRRIEAGSNVLSLKLGRLTPGRYRLALAVSAHGRKQATRRLSFSVR
jgi:hypothetical protein